MSDHIEKTIADLQNKLAEIEAEATSIKTVVNQLCEMSGRNPIYSDADIGKSVITTSISSDEFYGKPLATAVREVLDYRKNSIQDAPATVRDIFDTLKLGGYEFDTKNDENALRGLRISLSKNTSLFHKLPNGKFGLVIWYPRIRSKSKKSDITDPASNDTTGSEDTYDQNSDLDEENTDANV